MRPIIQSKSVRLFEHRLRAVKISATNNKSIAMNWRSIAVQFTKLQLGFIIKRGSTLQCCQLFLSVFKNGIDWWKFHNFTWNQFFFSDSLSGKSVILSHLEALNFYFMNFCTSEGWNLPNQQNAELIKFKKGRCRTSRRLSNIDFT